MTQRVRSIGSSGSWSRALGLAIGFKLLVSILVVLGGFKALSDDDYARIVIAQRFAVAPSFDPSQTSWLPLPFWLNGGVMLVLSREPWVARSVSLALGLAAVALCFAAAQRLGFSPRQALLGAALGGAFPYSAWLGVATVPELATAALIVFGASTSLSQSSLRTQLLGALALTAACLSRYEAWPVAAAFAGFALWDARHQLSKLWVALVSVSGPCAWMIHGSVNHGHPLFFVKRVADYQRAIGAEADSFVLALLSKPVAFLRCEPELVAALLVLLVAARVAGQRMRGGQGRFFVCLAVLLGFVVAADVRSAAATHHEERVVLALWLATALWVGGLAVAVPPSLSPVARRALTAALAMGVLGSLLWLRPWFARRDGFIDRSTHMALGRAARVSNPQARLLVDTPDFGFYAVLAGHGDPRLSQPLDDRDPRKTPSLDPFTNGDSLRAALAEKQASLLVTSGGRHRDVARSVGFELARSGELALFGLAPPL